MADRYDVVVIGGGTAGVVAAVQAARAGACTLLVEKCGMLGGTVTVGAVNYPASFFAWGKQVIAGIGWELVRRTFDQTGRHVPAEGQDVPRHLEVDLAVFACLADEAVQASECDLLLHAMLASARLDGQQWDLSLCTKTGLKTVRAGVLVDCTADANAVTQAGLDVETPEDFQPATLVVGVDGYDAKALDYAAIQKAFDAEVAAGRMLASDVGWRNGQIEFFLGSYGGNRIHVVGVDGRTSEGRTDAELKGRQALMRLVRFCRRQKGLESFRVRFIAPETAVRETVVIRGRTRVGIDDYLGGKVWPDAVCYAFYGVDIHLPTGIHHRQFEQGVVGTVPLGALIPEGSHRLIVAGRCVSSDREANSALRVEAPCMAMGQAAGAAAAIAAADGCDPGDVSLPKLRGLLREHGAIVPEGAAG